MKKSLSSFSSKNRSAHKWITVVNPTNHRKLLQACDDCGVVKSENSILKRCKAAKGQALVSGRMSIDTGMLDSA